MKYFPPNMTDELQPMDLVVNSMLKGQLRKLRIGVVMDYFQTYKADLHQWLRDKEANNGQIDQPKPVYNPTKPTYRDAVRTILDTIDSHLKTDKFAASLAACFEKVGLIPCPDGLFNNYVRRSAGLIRKDSIPLCNLDTSTGSDDCISGWLIDVYSRAEDHQYVDPDVLLGATEIEEDDEDDDDEDYQEDAPYDGEGEDDDDCVEYEEYNVVTTTTTSTSSSTTTTTTGTTTSTSSTVQGRSSRRVRNAYDRNELRSVLDRWEKTH